jgi:hypothetical protein
MRRNAPPGSLLRAYFPMRATCPPLASLPPKLGAVRHEGAKLALGPGGAPHGDVTLARESRALLFAQRSSREQWRVDTSLQETSQTSPSARGVAREQ